MAKTTLHPMTEPEFEVFRRASFAQFAQEKMRAEGLTAAEARAVAESSQARLLPHGLRSENQLLFTLRDAETHVPVGSLWLAIQARGARKAIWIYEIIVAEECRGKGYGESALRQVEQETRARGIDRVELHVFGHNTGARRLYERVGYGVTNITMGKDVTD